MTDTTVTTINNALDDDDDAPSDIAKGKEGRTRPASSKKKPDTDTSKPKADDAEKDASKDAKPKPDKDEDEPVQTVASGGGLVFDEAEDIEQLYAKILIYGDAGCGKTHAAVKAGSNVLVLTAEPQSVATIKRAAPKARIVRFKRPDGTISTTPPTWKDVTKFLEALLSGGAGSFDVLVIDGLHELLAKLTSDVLRDRSMKNASQYTLGQQGYGQLKQRTLLMLRFIRDLPCHVVVTMGAEHRKDDESNVEITGPLMEGGAKAQAAYMFNAVAYMYRVGLEDDDRMCMVDGPNTYVCRATRPLRGVIRPDVAKWIDVLVSSDDKLADELVIEGGKTPDAWRASKTATGTPATGNSLDDDE